MVWTDGRYNFKEFTYNVDDERTRKISPTLFIGLGGTGKDVLMRLRRKLFERYRRFQDDVVRFLLVDTDIQSFVPDGEDERRFRGLELRTDKNEVINCAISPQEFDEVFSMMLNTRDRRFAAWLHPRLKDLVPADALFNGAGMFRQVGRLAFFLHVHEIRNAIMDHIREMRQAASKRPDLVFGQPADLNPDTVEVVIVTSLAGGTGSGMFIDMAYLVRHVFQQPDFAKVKVASITLIAVLPNVFVRNVEKTPAMALRFKQNAYAALMEMEYYSTPRPTDEPWQPGHENIEFRVNWDNPLGDDTVIRARAWDTCFLIDDENDNRPGVYLSSKEIFQMIADYLFVDLDLSKFAVTKRSLRSNHASLRDCFIASTVLENSDNARTPTVLFANKYGCTFGSFGLSEIHIDKDRIDRCAAYRLAHRFCERVWLQGLPVDFVARRVADEILSGAPPEGERDVIPLSPPEVHKLFMTSEKDWAAVTSRLVENKNRHQLMAELERVDQDVADTSNNPRPSEFRLALDKCEWQLIGSPAKSTDLGKLRKRLESKVLECVSKYGIGNTLKVLEELGKRFEEWLIKIKQKYGQPVVDATQVVKRLDDAMQVPFPCSTIARGIELRRARLLARQAMLAKYEKLAWTYVEKVYLCLKDYVAGSSGGAGVQTIKEHVENLENCVKSIMDELDKKFDTLQPTDADQKRSRSLVPDWNKNDYTHNVEAAIARIYGNDLRSPDQPNWKAVEEAWLKSDTNKTDEGQRGLPVVMRLQSYQSRTRRNPDEFGRIAEELADALLSISNKREGDSGQRGLVKYPGDGNIVARLVELDDKQRKQYVQELVDSAAPYFPLIGRERIVAFPSYQNMLGMSLSAKDAETCKQLIVDTCQSRGRGGQDRVNKVDDAPEMTITFIREVGAVPIHYYIRLPDLEKAYFDESLAERRRSCHLSCNVTAEDLPDIQRLEDQEKKIIRDNIAFVLWGLMLEFMKVDKDGMVRAEVPDEYGWGRISFYLGSKISRVIRHACRIPSVRDFLQDNWVRWSREATPCKLAVLYRCCVKNLKFLESCKDVVVGQERYEVPLRNCFLVVFRETTNHLNNCTNGERWASILREDDAPQPTSSCETESFEKVKQYIDSHCLRIIHEQRLPLYRVETSVLDEFEKWCQTECKM